MQRFIAPSIADDAVALRLLDRVADPVDEHDEDGLTVTTALLRPSVREQERILRARRPGTDAARLESVKPG